MLSIRRISVRIIIVLALQPLLGHAQQETNARPTTSKSSLVLDSIAPSDGTQLTKKSVIVANLSYNITDFKNGRYTILAQFETKDGKNTKDGDFPNVDYPSLSQSTGELSFSFPIKYVWHHKDIKRPFVMWFYLMKWTDRSSGTRVASAGPVEFQAR